MTIFQIECFLAVAEHLNFAKASLQMNISQPAITRQIQSLEKELGARLFNRSTRSVSLTAEGSTLLTDAHIITGTSNRILKRFQKQDKEKIIDFHIGYPSSSYAECLKEPLEQLKSAYPYVHPRLHILPGPQLPEAVDRESIDVALSFRSQKEKNSLLYKELKKAPYVCICRKDCPVSALKIVTAADLIPYPMIIFESGTMPHDIIAGQWDWAKGKKPSMLYFSESTETSMFLVVAGFGVTVIPNIFVPLNQSLQVCKLKNSKKISFGLYHKAEQESPWMKTFISLMKDSFSSV